MNSKDARPFVDLHNDAQEFKEKFDEDIKKCTAFLDSKITSLICDPDSLDNSTKGVKSSALVEFSKAKYEIFVGVKSLINDMEREWMKYISEMKKLFIENVEIFLANTRLEVKLPYERPPSPKKSPGNQRTSLSNTLYPIISTIAKKMPGIGSPVQTSQDSQATVGENIESFSKAEVKSQFNRRSRASASSIKLSSNRGLNSNILAPDSDSSSSEEEPDDETPAVRGRGRNKAPSRNASKASQENNVINSRGRRSKLPPAQEDPVQSTSIPENREIKKNVVNSRGRRNKLPAQEIPEESIENNETEPSETITTKTSPKKRGRGRKAQNSTSVAENAFNGGNEEPMEVEINPPRPSTRGRRGKENTETASKSAPNVTRRRGKAKSTAQKTNHNEDERPMNTSPRVTSRAAIKDELLERNVSVSPKKVTFHEIPGFSDLEYGNFAARSKSVGRRKTMMPADVGITESDFDMTKSRSRGKRKTIGGITELTSAVPPKRLRVGDSMRDVSSQDEEDADNNLLENGEYSEWMPLINLGAKVPVQPGIYEVKVWRAKKTAFIGSCENLRQKLILHRLQQNSGHKHLDKFLERNINDIQIRYEVMPSENEAKAEVKKRIQSFVTQYKTTPAYN